MVKHWMARLLNGRTTVSNALAEVRPEPEFEATWRHGLRGRLVILAVVMGLWATALEARLVLLQVVRHERLAERALKQQGRRVEVPGVRGDIVDRTGQTLAISVPGRFVHVDPRAANAKDLKGEAQEICAAFQDCTAKDLNALIETLKLDTNYAVIRSAANTTPEIVARIDETNAKRVSAKKKKVMGTIPQAFRLYPKKELAAHLLGFVDKDSTGIAGLELAYDKLVAGTGGIVRYELDGSYKRDLNTEVLKAPTVGAGLELTIHAELQHVLERELERTVIEERAEGGTIVVLDPYTGEVLANASYPTFNPNSAAAASDRARLNRAVQSVYEPGSTLKIVTMAAALSEGLLTPSTLIDCNPGFIRVPGRGKLIKEDKGRNYGVLSFEKVLIKSSNVGAVKVGDVVGTDRLMRWLRAFGFGERASSEVRGESKGIVKPASAITESGRASISMGYEIAVTPLQLAAATSVIANGGVLVQPRLVRAVLHSNGRREVKEPVALRRVIDPDVAATMTAIMEGVVAEGTGKSAALTRYHVAGKTGTAHKAIAGGYSDTDYDVSFVGFVPSRRPAFTIVTVIDTPRKSRPYGGTVAAPLFKRVAEAAVQLLGVTPSINPEAPVIRTATPPPVRAAGTPAVTLVGDRPAMPDLTGVGLRDARRIANQLQLRVSADGDGVVFAQSPVAGTVIQPGMTTTLRLRRQPAKDEGR